MNAYHAIYDGPRGREEAIVIGRSATDAIENLQFRVDSIQAIHSVTQLIGRVVLPKSLP